MRKVTRYQTSDGVLHDSERAALRHADERFGSALTGIAHEMVHLTRYREIVEFLERNLPRFVALNELKKDMELEEEETES